jgi:hypothetical protein
LAPLNQEEVVRRLETSTEEIEQFFQANQHALAYKTIAQIAGT